MSDPETVTPEQMHAAYDALSLDPDRWIATTRIELTPTDVCITRHVLDEDGHVQLDPARPNETLVETITIWVR